MPADSCPFGACFPRQGGRSPGRSPSSGLTYARPVSAAHTPCVRYVARGTQAAVLSAYVDAGWVLGGVAVLTASTPIRCRAACSGAQCRHPRAGGRPVGCRAGAVCSPPNLPCSAKGACHAVPVGTLVGPALIPPPSPPVQSQLSTLQASGSAMAVGALQGILAQLKSLSNQIHGEHTPPGARDGPHAHQSPS